jgi:hypothetical protein
MSVVINGTGSISGLSNVGGIASAQSGSIIQTVSFTWTKLLLVKQHRSTFVYYWIFSCNYYSSIFNKQNFV